MRASYHVAWTVVVLVVAAVGGAAVGGVAADSGGDEPTATPPTATAQETACDYAALFNRTIESVVSVRTQAGQGSGFVYQAENGTSHVVTNAHVVGNASSVIVQFDRDEYRNGTVVGRDVFSDLAVVRVDRTPDYVSALPVAGSDPVRGERVAALGNPLGLEETITQGIVSGVNRSMPTQFGFTIPNVVQTDAAISPGSSGGPLVTCDGTVVGVNAAGIVAQGAENIGFAISPTLVERVVPRLVETGDYEYPFLGVSTREVTPPVAQANDLDATRGVVVASVVEGGPSAGTLQGATRIENVSGVPVPIGGDVIVAIDDRSIRTSEDLSTYLVTQTRPGDTVTLTVVRDGERQQVNVTLGERPEPETA